MVNRRRAKGGQMFNMLTRKSIGFWLPVAA
jgi:hypothetical protein